MSKQAELAQLADAVTVDGGNVGLDGIHLGGTGSANLLDDYEKGTWTPVDASSASLTFSAVHSATYSKIGNLVYLASYISYPTNSSNESMSVGGLPFKASAGNYYGELTVRVPNDTISSQNLTFQITTDTHLGSIHSGTLPLSNATMSGKLCLISGTYQTDE